MNDNKVARIIKRVEEYLQNPTPDLLDDIVKILKDYADKPACPSCSSRNVVKNGKYRLKTGTLQQFLCKACNQQFTKNSIESKIRRD